MSRPPQSALAASSSSAAGAASSAFTPVGARSAASSLVASSSPIAAHSSRSDVRQLLIGMPSRAEALKAQRSNLEKFVRMRQSSFDALPFYPWTTGTHKIKTKTRIIPSQLPGCAGLLGVALEDSVPASGSGKKKDAPKVLLYYPGLLMTETLYTEFAQLYHCPTALELPAMTQCSAWKKKNLQPEKMLVVGDPTQPGCIINDGERSGVEGQSQHCSWSILLCRQSSCSMCFCCCFSVCLRSQLQTAVCAHRHAATRGD